MDGKLFELMEKMYSEFNSKFDTLNQEVKTINNNVDKNALLLENLNDKVRIISEVQQNHLEVNVRQHREMLHTVNEELSVVKSAIKHISDNIEYLEHKENQIGKDIFKLKKNLEAV